MLHGIMCIRFGGLSRTIVTVRYGNEVVVEVMVALLRAVVSVPEVAMVNRDESLMH